MVGDTSDGDDAVEVKRQGGVEGLVAIEYSKLIFVEHREVDGRLSHIFGLQAVEFSIRA